MMVSASPLLGGGLLIGAGVYELTPSSTRASPTVARLRISSHNIGALDSQGRFGSGSHSGSTASAAAGC